MKLLSLKPILFLLVLMAAPSWSCSFCSTKPKALPGMAQDPGSPMPTSATGSMNNSGQGQWGNSGRSNGSNFGTNLKDYQADGQRSNNPNWSSGDFFNSR